MQVNRHVKLIAFFLLASICLSSLLLLSRQSKENAITANNGTGPRNAPDGLIIEAPKDGAVAPVIPANTGIQANPVNQPALTTSAPKSSSRFIDVALSKGRDINQLCSPGDTVNRAVLSAYGAIYVADVAVKVPPNCTPTRSELEAFYRTVQFENDNFDGVAVSFQKAALDAFRKIRAEAAAQGLTVTPNGTRASLRDYDGTVEIWQRNLSIGINSARGISGAEMRQLRSSNVRESIDAVLKVEARGTLLGSGGGKSILQIAAPPGTSQHISGLSIDIAEHESSQVRAIMAKHGFFQTIANDFTHFTYLGESSTTSLGLVAVTIDGRVFFVPKL